MPRQPSASRPDNELRNSRDRREMARGGRRGSDAIQSEEIPKLTASARPLILVVDDFSDGREMVAEYLTFLGFRVATAQTGTEAVAAVVALRPDLVIMDVLLPDADGIDVIRQIRALDATQATRIVVCTAVVMGDVRARAKEANVDMFVPKPCDLKLFARQIGHLLLRASQLS